MFENLILRPTTSEPLNFSSKVMVLLQEKHLQWNILKLMQFSSFDEIVLVSTLLNSIVEASQSFFFFYCMCGKRQCLAASPLFLGSTVLRWMERNEVTHGMPMSFASVVPSLLSLVGPLLLSFLTSAFFWWKFFLLFLVVDEIGLHFLGKHKKKNLLYQESI